MTEKSGYPEHQVPPPSYEASTGPGPYNQPQPQPAPQFAQPQMQGSTQQTTQVLYQVRPAVVLTQVGPHPVYITCPACHQYTLTRMEFEPSTKTHLMAALLCLVGCFFCACIPYCIDSCMNGNHYCSHCGAYVGTFSN